MNRYLLVLFFVLTCKLSVADIIDDVAVVFKSGNSKELAQYFSSTLELGILNQEGIYSQVQAEQVIKEFFQKNVPVSFKVIHKVVSNVNYKYGVIMLNTSRNSYRVSYELKSTPAGFLITQIRIEDNKS